MKLSLILISTVTFCLLFQNCNIKKSSTTKLKTIPFDSIKTTTPEEIFDLTDVTVIPLETSKAFLISDNVRLKISDKNIFILDLSSKQMFRFNEEGHFLNTIGSIGEGPKEYLHPVDFIIDTIKKSVEILENIPSAFVKRYNYDGSFISEFKFDFSAISFIKDKSSNYYFYCGINDYSGDKYRVKYTDSTKIYAELFKNTGKPGIGYFPYDIDIFSDNRNGIFFKEHFFSSIYLLDKDSVRKIIEFDFGEHSFYPEDLAKIESTAKFLSTLTEKGFYGFMSLLSYNDTFLFNLIFQSNNGVKIYYLLYDSGNNKIVKTSFDEKSSLFWNGRLRGFQNDKFIFTLDAINTKSVSNQLPSLKSKFQNVNEDDNPVILIFKNKIKT